ncbi:MAG TPA: MBOAT family protein [Thermoanaerobaculia bacterium]|nr:MBOAT family protein [Thermoanaerobaculia bacterium]
MSALERMVVIVTITFVAMKVVVLAVARAPLTWRQRLAFFAWPGMRPALFASLGGAPRPGAASLAWRGARNAAAGAALFAIARLLEAPWLAMIAISLLMHFGAFTLLAAFWRTRGVAANALFRAPLAARSLAELWSRRWNVGYSEMIALLVHRPVCARFGPRAALAASFLVSGLLHELAITVPIGASYGLPTLYFAIQGIGVAIERRRELGPAWVIPWLVIPLPLCFPPPFVEQIIRPLV